MTYRRQGDVEVEDGPDTRSSFRLLHSSDLHLGQQYSFPPDGHGNTGSAVASAMLELMVCAIETHSVDILVLAGDVFDHNRVSDALVREAVNCMRRTDAPIVILPGNHDPLTRDSVYVRNQDRFPENVHILGLNAPQSLVFDDLTLELWGRPHTSYHDFRPLESPPTWGAPAVQRWRVAVGHGHLVESKWDEGYSYQISTDELEALEADYVALGHWDIHHEAEVHGAVARYSGSPCRIGSFTIVDFGSAGIEVRQIDAE